MSTQQPPEPAPVEQFFDEWRAALCPLCKETPLDLQFKSPVRWWCAWCRAWFNEKLERI